MCDMKIQVMKNNRNETESLFPMKTRIKKYAIGAHGVAATAAGVVGFTAISEGSVQVFNLGSLENKTFIADGTGTGGSATFEYLLAQSADAGDKITITGNNNYVTFFATGGAQLYRNTTGYGNADYFSIGTAISGSASQNTGYLVYNNNTNYAPWNVDRFGGAVAFKDGDGNKGFFNITWDVSAKTLTILGGSFEDSGGALTVTAVPEPSIYAAALGLGALGVAYYRRRPDVKTRPKAA